MSYLFDTNAISEPLRRKPSPDYLAWLKRIEPERQYTSILVVAELLAGAYGSPAPEKWLSRLENDVLPMVTVLDFNYGCANAYGKLRAHLRSIGKPIGDVDTQLAATALYFGLTMVTANGKHFKDCPDLKLHVFKPGQA